MEGNNARQALQELLETYGARREGGRELGRSRWLSGWEATIEKERVAPRGG